MTHDLIFNVIIHRHSSTSSSIIHRPSSTSSIIIHRHSSTSTIIHLTLSCYLLLPNSCPLLPPAFLSGHVAHQWLHHGPRSLWSGCGASSVGRHAGAPSCANASSNDQCPLWRQRGPLRVTLEMTDIAMEITIESRFSLENWWFSTAMLNYQRVYCWWCMAQ